MTISATSYGFVDLKNEVTDIIQSALTSIPNYSSLNADIGHYINRGYIEFVRAVGGIEDRIDITPVANQVEYTNSDAENLAYVLRIIKVKWDENADSYASSTWEGKHLVPYPGGYTNLPKVRIYTSNPASYWYRKVRNKDGIVLGTDPIINTGTGYIRVWCTRIPTSLLSSDAHEPDIQVQYQPALVHFAAWKILSLYSHRNKLWKDKALDQKAYYMEILGNALRDYSYDSYDDVLHIQDAY